MRLRSKNGKSLTIPFKRNIKTFKQATATTACPRCQTQWRRHENAYKIKLRDSGYRLVYEVNDNTITVLVLAVGKRDKCQAYEAARQRK